MKKIGIIGCRARNGIEDYQKCLKAFLKIYKEDDEIVSGGCPKGGDRFAEIIAKDHGIPIKIFYPNWNKYGKRAGFVRNADIARTADIVIAVVSLERKGGTEDTINRAESLSKPIILVNS